MQPIYAIVSYDDCPPKYANTPEGKYKGIHVRGGLAELQKIAKRMNENGKGATYYIELAEEQTMPANVL